MKAPDMSKMNREFERLGEALRRSSRSFVLMRRGVQRMYYTPGDRHIERVVKEILSGKPGRPAALRLECASMMAEVLDR